MHCKTCDRLVCDECIISRNRQKVFSIISEFLMKHH
jgi:hypothetical protein